jgi:hypothetical protein
MCIDRFPPEFFAGRAGEREGEPELLLLISLFELSVPRFLSMT